MRLLLILLISVSVLYGQIQPEFVSLQPKYKNSAIFEYTGSVQTWTVPSGVNYIFVDAKGAQGGTFSTNIGGKGGCIRARFPVTPGQILYITVGGQSTIDTPLFGYGGSGGRATNYNTRGRAGGGLSAISTSFPVNQANAILISGGGGGSNGYNGVGGNAGGVNGTNANNSISYGATPIYGYGATQTSGGNQASTVDPNSPNPTAGVAINGGNGGWVGGLSAGWTGGGGGGAGYFGGGGGAGGGNAQGGGGGGSSWTHSSCINVENITGYNSGHGRVVIYW